MFTYPMICQWVWRIQFLQRSSKWRCRATPCAQPSSINEHCLAPFNSAITKIKENDKKCIELGPEGLMKRVIYQKNGGFKRNILLYDHFFKLAVRSEI